MKIAALFFLSMICASSYAQSSVIGRITDSQGNPLPGVSIYLLNTLDGTSADANGNYTITTTEKGNQILVVSSIGYQTFNQPLVLKNKKYVYDFKLVEAVNELEEVVISAGTIEATNDRKVAVLRPLDIVTTAGAAGDIIGAIQTLPGTTRVGEQTGLFVRGGDASETSVIIDGMVVQNFFTSDVPGVAQRSRFSPFQFKGTSFSSGGYGVRYGQALSSILELNTNDMPTRGTLNAGINMAGAFGSAAKVFKTNSIELTGNYTNVAPFYKLANTNFDFYKAPEGGSGSVRWVSKGGDKSIFKLLASGGAFGSGTEIPDLTNAGAKYRFGIQNKNGYVNSSYLLTINPRLQSYSAISVSANEDNNNFGTSQSRTIEWRLQARTEVAYELTNKVNLLAGTEWQRFAAERNFNNLQSSFYETHAAAYTELEWRPSKWLGFKSGVRGEHSLLLDRSTVSPRISVAIKTGQQSQVSVASGIFYQNPNSRYLFTENRPDFQRAIHYIANYQWVSEKQTFRIEGYYKSYNSLVRELGVPYDPNTYRFVTTTVDNSGKGYAQGLDLFWRDKRLLKNLDYWISYSLVDTKRLYETFPTEATPSFVATHNLNVIGKYFIKPLKLNIAATYTYSSGRPYYNPNDSKFLGSLAPYYENLSVNISYVTTIKKVFSVFYFGVDNILDRHNVFGYRFTADGSQQFPIEPPLYRSVFVGMNFSLSAFNKDEL